MSFLKIGDRAAGAIKSGGTTRRAAKMVVLDLDHPDIEEFVNWKVVEEQKVAALVAGSKLLNRHLNAVLKAIHGWPKAEEQVRPARRTPTCARRSLEARHALVPENYIARVIQLAQQGFTSLEVEEYDTDWNSKAYYTVSRPEQQQLGAHHQRVHEGRRRRRRLAPVLADGEGEGEEARAARRSRRRR